MDGAPRLIFQKQMRFRLVYKYTRKSLKQPQRKSSSITITFDKGDEVMAQAQDKHCDGCGWAGNTSSDTCPSCQRELEDD